MARAPGSEIASAAPLCADSEDLDWKHLILSSVLSTKLHQWMAGKLYLMKGTAPYERSLKSQSWDWFIQKEVVAFCDCHLLDYGTDARRKRAIKVLEEAFLMRRGWDWIGKWLSFQFTKRSD